MNIISHLPLNNSPILDGVDLLPPLEDEVEKLAIEEVGIDGQIYNISDNESFIKGYNKAKEKYKYTDEDILIIRNKLVSILPTGDVSAWDMIMALSNYTKWFDKYTQSLQQPKIPIGFEFEFSKLKTKDLGNGFSEFETPLQTQWVGKYLY
jgi:hypothetical protein